MSEEKEKIREALRIFVKKDRNALLKNRVYEPTLSHRIAVYLESQFPRYNIDCEYNKNHANSKMDSNMKKIRPDIIIHIRNNFNNLIIFEIKKGSKDTKRGKEDIQKLRNCSNLNYKLRVFVGILKRKLDIVWIGYDNEEISETLI